jgi:hypothetical protein
MDKMETLHEFLEEVHEVGAKVILAGFILHMAGMLKHLIIDRDGTLRRMLVPVNRPNGPEKSLTPHVASLTAATYRALCLRTAENVVRVLRGEKPDPRSVFGRC